MTQEAKLDIQSLIDQYEHKQPEVVFEWKDAETEAEGWVVINSLRGGAAGGGTRMRKGLNKHEVVSLAKTMEVKFSVCGPPIGGAKSGINFDPADPRKQGVLERWYKAVYPLLKNYYGTGGDLNVDEIHEVIPITESYGLLHPQEGVVNGHLRLDDVQKATRITQLQEGVSKRLDNSVFSPDVNRNFVVADMITGYGVAVAVKHYYDIWGGDIGTKRAIIQGWGNVGAAAAYYLARFGVKITGIIDRAGGLLSTEGMDYDAIRQLFLNKDGNQLVSDQALPFAEVNDKVWDIGAEIFIPAAASRLVTQEQVDRMTTAGLEVVSCGANVPFADPEIFFGPISAHADQQVNVIPDFIANCGMARVFAYLMGENAQIDDRAIFEDTSAVIHRALERLHVHCPEGKRLSEKGLELALQQLV